MFVKISYFLSENLLMISMVITMLYIFRLIIRKDRQSLKAVQVYNKNKKQGLTEAQSLYPRIDKQLCIGCGSCVKACPEGPVIQLIHQKAVLVQPTKCIGHGVCEEVCPVDAITLIFGSKTIGKEVPSLTEHYETNIGGLYIAGELGGMGLIRNGFVQGSAAAEHALKSKTKGSKKNDLDLLIIGAGPAGISASLKAKELKANYLCIDQNHFGGAVYARFPKNKTVMIQPVKAPIVGKFKYPNNKISKENLLAHWSHIVTAQKLKIMHKVKFDSLRQLEAGGFKVHTSNGYLSANKVILAMGVGGTPRKLGLPNQDLDKIHYNMLDADKFQGQYIAIVGGGNSAIEAAQMLCNPKLKNRVILLVRKSVINKANEDNKKIILDFERKKLIKILYNTTISQIEKQEIEINSNGKKMRVKNSTIFVFAGAEMPYEFLESLGVKITKKYGESLTKKKAS